MLEVEFRGGPNVDDISGKPGTILTLVQVVRRALMDDYLEAYQRAVKVGRGDAWSDCGVASSVVSLLKAWEGPGTPSQWAEVMRMCGYAQQAVFIHWAARQRIGAMASDKVKGVSPRSFMPSSTRRCLSS